MTPEELQKTWSDIEESLQEGDILMFHKREGWISKKIRKTSKSYWNHTGLVFMARDKFPVGGPLIVEASFVGIEVHQMKRYTDHFDEYDIGVLRYPNLTERQKEEIVMGFILSNLDVTYDYSRLAAFFLSPITQKLPQWFRKAYFKYFTHEESYVCTTFVHKAFHELSGHEHGKEEDETGDSEYEALLDEEFITPADIAREPIFEWVFNKQD